jgi:hypothetical protein
MRLDLADRLAELPYTSGLREDERIRIASRFAIVVLQPTQSRTISADAPEMIIVLEGEASLRTEGSETPVPLFETDVVGDLEIIAGAAPARSVTAVAATTLAVLDRPALELLLDDFPAIAPPWIAELGRELKWRNDMLREVSLARAEGLPQQAMEAMLSRRRKRLQHRRRSLFRSAVRHLLTALFTAPRKRPSFWVLVGALCALAAARTVVAVIIKNGLQKHLFALIGGQVGHPLHVHHFNYGLLLVSISGVLALLPRTRQAILRLAFVFGFGVGLIVDEFALLWNLNPDYYQPLSRLAAGAAVILIVQIVYFRNLYLALGKRLLALVRA